MGQQLSECDKILALKKVNRLLPMGTEEDNPSVGEGRKCSAFGFIVAIQETVGFLFLIVHSLIEFGVEMIQ